MSCASNLWLILFIFPFQTNFILSSPVPEFEFPKSGISFSSSDENDEYKDISRCLNEEDYSMPYFDPKTRQVYLKVILICITKRELKSQKFSQSFYSKIFSA